MLYGDSYLTCDYQDVARAFVESGRRGLMTIYRNDDKFDASNVELGDGRIIRYDKTPNSSGLTHIDYGLGGLKAEVLTEIHRERFDLVEVYQSLIAAGALAAYEVTERFYEIGSTSGLEATRRLLAGKEQD